MSDDPRDLLNEQLHAANRQLADQLERAMAGKAKLGLWLSDLLQSLGGSAEMFGEPVDVSKVHIRTEHRCAGTDGHGTGCRTRLELHEGTATACQHDACVRLQRSPEVAPGVHAEHTVEPSPTAAAERLQASYTAKMQASEAWQHPERN